MFTKAYHELCHKLMAVIFVMCVPDSKKFHFVNFLNVTPSGAQVNSTMLFLFFSPNTFWSLRDDNPGNSQKSHNIETYGQPSHSISATNTTPISTACQWQNSVPGQSGSHLHIFSST
jgi:hypothetical protein